MSDAEPASEATAVEDASRVVISYPADLSTWGRQQVDTRHFRAYLRKTMGSVDVGDAVDAFVGVGCCGDSLDVPLVVEDVEDGSHVGDETEVVYEVREACDLQGGWRVQSEGGPTE